MVNHRSRYSALFVTRAYTTDIPQRYQTSYTTLCNGVVSCGAQFGGLWVFADHTRKNKRKTNEDPSMRTSYVRLISFIFFFLLQANRAIRKIKMSNSEK